MALDGLSLLNIAGGLLLTVAGAFFVRHRALRPANVWFGIFAIGLGLFEIASSFEGPEPAHQLPLAMLRAVAGVGLVGFALLAPAPLRRDERAAVRLALLPALGVVAWRLWHLLVPMPAAIAAGPAHPDFLGDLAVVIRVSSTVVFYHGATWFTAFLLLGRHARSSEAPASYRRETVLLALVLVTPILLYSTARAFATARNVQALGQSALAAGLLLGLLWLARARTAPESRPPVVLALTVLGACLAGLLAGVARPDLDTGVLANYVQVLLLAYVVLRHQTLGIDVRLRWTISKGTIAAVFVAVFFVASEAAQQFFGETLESTYLGIAAAGALVLALAPLQRAAERLAEKAVPVRAPPPIESTTHHEQYRVLLRRYLGDGRLSREEEMALAHAAAGLGIPANEALRLRHEVEDERGRS